MCLALVQLLVAAPAQADPLVIQESQHSIAGVVEQQSPNFFNPPCSGGTGDGCEPETWVRNPTRCLWDADDNALVDGYGTLDAGESASGTLCAIADQYDNYGGDDHMLFATVYAPVDALTVTLSNDHGVSEQLVPLPDDGNGYRYYTCHVDHTPGPYPAVPDSNGGTGVRVEYALTVTAPPKRAARAVRAILEAPLVGTGRWFDAWEAGCR